MASEYTDAQLSSDLKTAPLQRKQSTEGGTKETVIDKVTADIQSHYTDKHEHKPTLFASLIVAHPQTCCMFWCCFYFLLTLGLTIALALGGFDPLPTDRISEVNLNLPFAESTMRTQAFFRTQSIADYGSVQYTCRQSDPSGGYISMFANAGEGKNVLTKKGLEYMKEVEEHVLNTKDFAKYCYLNTAECSADTATSSSVLKTSSTCCVYVVENITDNNGCFLPQSTTYWFRKYGDPGFNDIDGTIALIKATSDTDYANFQAGLHKEFPNNGKSEVIRSGYMMGVPLHSPNNETTSNNEDDCSDKCEERELEDVEDYLFKKLDGYLEKQFQKSGPYNLLYAYSGYDPISSQIVSDLLLAIFGIIAVYIYTTVSFKSLFLGSCVMFQIFMAFFGGNLTYRYLFPSADGFGYKYFTMFQALTIFIIIGVGCDNCFVFHGQWSAGAGKYRDDVQRLSASQAHAGKVMLVTTITTSASFLSNVLSEFPLIAAFGTFAAVVVFFNFFMVITYFPVVIYFHHHKYGKVREEKEKNDKKSQRRAAAKQKTVPVTENAQGVENYTEKDMDKQTSIPKGTPTEPKQATTEVETSASAPRGATTSNDNEKVEKTSSRFSCSNLIAFFKYLMHLNLNEFMANTYAPWVFKYRFYILAFASCFMIGFLVLASLVVAVPFFMYSVFPEGTNFHDVTYIVQTQMSSLASPLYAYVTFGFDVDKPLEYANDFKPYNFELGEDGSGTPLFDTKFDITEPLTQLQLLETCTLLKDDTLDNSGLKIDTNYGINPQLDGGGAVDTRGGEFGIQCPMGAFAKYLDVSTYHPIDGDFSAPAVSEWTDDDKESCMYCFTNFSASSQPSTSNGTSYATSTYSYTYPEVPSSIMNTSEVIDGCNCGGLFPVPRATCLEELDYLSKGTRYKCFDSGESAFFNDFEGFLLNSQTNFDWWKDYIFATATRKGDFDRVVMSYIKVQTTMSATDADFLKGLEVVKNWDRWANRYNKRMKELADSVDEPEPSKAMVYIPTALEWKSSSRLGPNAISNTLVSLCLAFCVVLFATFNWIITCMAIFVVGCIVTVIFGSFHAFGWDLGVLESILCVIVVGFSVDFTIHLADSYLENSGDNDEDNAINTDETAEAIRYRKVRGALGVTGVSIISGGLSTLLGTFSMMLATITFFSRFGIVMFLTMFLSVSFSLLPFAAALMVMGPLGTDGMLSNFYGPMLQRSYDKLQAERSKALAHVPTHTASSLTQPKISAKTINLDDDTEAAEEGL